MRDCTVELATLQVLGLDTTLRLATSREVSPVASGSGTVVGVSVGGDVGRLGASEEEAGESDDSYLDGDYVPPKQSPSSSDSESDQGADFTTSRKHKAGSWRLRLGNPAKVSKVGRKAAKVSWKTCEVLWFCDYCNMYLFSALGLLDWKLPGLHTLQSVSVVMRGRLNRPWFLARLRMWSLTSLMSQLLLLLFQLVLCRQVACR